MKPHLSRLVLAVLGAALTPALLAAPFTYIRVGDKDGFGYNPAGLKRATPAPHNVAADTDGDGLLEQGEYLPDRNLNGQVATGAGDDFDNRSGAEIANSVVQGSGFTALAGTAGSKWTDISLSTSFTGPNFPDPAGPAAPNQPVFSFRFDVAKPDIVTGSTLFFNLIFGDYDVVPASVSVTKNNGSGGAGASSTIALTTQPGGADGLIQAAFLNLSFFDVFSDGGLVWNGYLDVKFNAPNEPYTAFDFAELSLDQIPFDPNVPDSGGTLVLVAAAGAMLASIRRRRH